MNFRILVKTGSLALFSVLFLGACASTTPDTYSNVAPGSDFRGIKTYGFLSELSTDKADYQSLESNYLKVAVARQMDLRGLQYDPVSPEVVMNFYILKDEKVKTRQTPAMGGGYYGYRGGYYDGFGYGGAAYETRIDQYTVGTLTIDMIDPKARKLLWEGTVTGRLTKKDVENLEATIGEAVRDIFVKFPVLDAQH
ncbi:MAG: DUF4136 domain-containing protein [Halioglobus sp.]